MGRTVGGWVGGGVWGWGGGGRGSGLMEHFSTKKRWQLLGLQINTRGVTGPGQQHCVAASGGSFVPDEGVRKSIVMEYV